MKTNKTSTSHRAVFNILALLIFASCFGVVSVLSAESLWTERPHSGMVSDQKVIGSGLFRNLAEKNGPAVVNIRIMKKVSRFQQFAPFFPPRELPPGTQNDDYQQRGEGSGFIIHKDGYILSNAHVVAESDQIQVALASGKLFKGKVLGFDHETDIALIKIDAPQPLPVLPLGDSDQLKPGDWVMAIGSPFGLEQTVTVGIVSGKGRSLGASPYDDFIQTDASINPGNSGGPLINILGEVVGINTAILAQGQGLGFSLPINLVKKLVPRLKAYGRVIRSWLGVNVQDITLELKETAGVTVDSGSFVSNVIADGPAFKAGIRKWDVIIEFDGKPILKSRELPTRVAHSEPGSKVILGVMRGDKKLNFTVTLENLPGQR